MCTTSVLAFVTFATQSLAVYNDKNIIVMFQKEASKYFSSGLESNSLSDVKFTFNNQDYSGTAFATNGIINEIDDLDFLFKEYNPPDEDGVFSLRYYFRIPKITFSYKTISLDSTSGTSVCGIRFTVYNANLTVFLAGTTDALTCYLEDPVSKLTLEPGQYDYELLDVDDRFFNEPLLYVAKNIVISNMSDGEGELFRAIQSALDEVGEFMVEDSWNIIVEELKSKEVDVCRIDIE